MARDSDALGISKWAETGDVQTPENAGLDRAEGWPAQYSQAGGPTPQREVFNQIFRELTALAVEINNNGAVLVWSTNVDYVSHAIVRGSNGLLYQAVQPSGPATGNAIDPLSDDGSHWTVFVADSQSGIDYFISQAGLNIDYSDSTQLYSAFQNLMPSTDDFIQEADVTAVAPAGAFGGAFFHAQDQKPNSTNGGTGLAGDNVRDLNTVLTNEISGASLSNNQITLPSGDYFIEASVPHYHEGGNALSRHRGYLYNVSDSLSEVLGTSEAQNNESGVSMTTRSFISGRFSITAQKVFELRHYTGIAASSANLGRSSSQGIEIYSDIKVWKVG